jgi:prophage maintenance system killer protein
MTDSLEHTGGEVVIYESPDGEVRLDVRLERDSIWLSQKQMAELFGRERSVITRHIQRALADDELSPESNVQKVHIASSDRPVSLYSLDAVISVGYRVNSARGTQFRIWATRTLRDHVLQGYTLNEQRLRERGLGEMQQAVELLSRTLVQNALVTDEGAAVLDVVRTYASTWRLLLEYDEQSLAEAPARPRAAAAPLTLGAARGLIRELRAASAHATAGLLGQERGDQLAAILEGLEQTFDGRPLYPSAQSRAAHLLYFVIKDHPFADGNKRIAALLFLEYLSRSGLLFRSGGAPRLADNAVVALTLLVAESRPDQKDLMVRLVINLLDTGDAPAAEG